MNLQENILVTVMEECTELAEECNKLAKCIAKSLRFGLYDRQPGKLINVKRIQAEFNDVLGSIEALNDMCGTDIHADPVLITLKRKKMARYREYSKNCGTLQVDEDSDHAN